MRRSLQFTTPQFIALVLSILLVGAITATTVLAGSMDAPGGPGDPSAQMFTLRQLYERLTTGADGTKMAAFTEPSSAPGSTMVTLDQLMAAAPAMDDSDGAIANEVLSDQTFWGLTSGEWGLQTGAMPLGADLTGAEGELTIPIPDGYYAGKSATAVDSDLLAANIKRGVNIFGVDGELTRFIVNGDNTITDTQTGLMWPAHPDGISFSAQRNDAGNAVNLFFNDIAVGGYTDWRLPEVWELYTLVDERENNPSLPPGHPFNTIQTRIHWTITEFGSSSFIVNFYDGSIYIGDPTEFHFIFPVRR